MGCPNRKTSHTTYPTRHRGQSECLPAPPPPTNAPPRSPLPLYSALLLANLLLLAIAISLISSFGLAWSNGSPVASSYRALSLRGGKFSHLRFDLSPPGAPPLPLHFWTKPASTGPWAPPPAAPILTTYTFTIPIWLVCIPLAMPIWFLARRSYRASLRAQRGHCRTCNYDLNALIAEGINTCPECGTKRRSSPRRDDGL